MGKLLTLVTLLVIGGGGYLTYRCYHECPKAATKFLPTRADGWFGRKTLKVGQQIPKDNTEIRPFTINISDTVLQDLKFRLDNSRFVDHVEDTQFNYGFNSLELKKVVDYWRTKYNWRQQEKMLNSYPQFKTQIEGIDIHFLHVKPSKPAKVVLPLLISHGWPGSVLEYYKTIPMLTEPVNDVAFELVIPSIPGYGYSEAPHQKGFGTFACARVFVKLMKRLGHEKFFIHGGDWGHFISRVTGSLYPENLLGVHVIGNYYTAPVTVCDAVKLFITALAPRLLYGENSQKEYEKFFPVGQKVGLIAAESGYMHLQATKPDTLGSALVDSPAGLAAYILEKFSSWTNLANPDKENGGLTEKFTLDELITNLMIYWTSNNVASSVRFYKESLKTWLTEINSANLKVKVPAATIDSKHDLTRAPRKLIESQYTDLIQYTEFEIGGHFTAFEEPKLVVDDFRKFVSKVLELKQKEHEQKKRKDKHTEM